MSAPFVNALAGNAEGNGPLNKYPTGAQRRGSEGEDGSGLNVEYVKNVFVKYMEYLALQDQKGMKTLEKVLFTVLGLSKEEVDDIESTRAKASTVWGYLGWTDGSSANNNSGGSSK